MMTATTTQREHRRVQRVFAPQELREEALPEGVCGRLVGVGLVYEQADAFDTIWATGCLDITKQSKVAAGKVALFTAGQYGHEYGVRSHVGVVRSAETRGNEELISADLYDTEDGRRTKEYLSAILRAKGAVGLSIGCYVRRDERTADGAERYLEVELEEFTITPRPAVPGADVDTVRQNPDAAWALFDALVATLSPDDVRARVARLPGHSDDPDQVAPGAASSTPEATASQSDDGRPAGTRVATEAERARALAAATLGIDYHV
jgi:hypothetical protein